MRDNSGDAAGREREQQLPLRYDGTHDYDGAWALMLKMIRAIVDQVGLKHVAYDLDVSPSQLSHALNERERHNVLGRWLPYFILKAKDDDLVAFMALLRGRALKPRLELTPEEKLSRILAAMGEQLGAEARALILRHAFSEESK